MLPSIAPAWHKDGHMGRRPNRVAATEKDEESGDKLIKILKAHV